MAPDTFVLADMFRTVRHRGTQKKTGMPILYFKADTSKAGHTAEFSTADPGSRTNVYEYTDNGSILRLGDPKAGVLDSNYHPMYQPSPEFPTIFYENTWNENFTEPRRPYRAESFILLSAGADGLYGTVDDIYNFEKE